MTEPNDRRAMDRARLLQLLDSYGADPARWPEPERPAALALLARDPEAQCAQREAAALDQFLDGADALEPSAALRRAVAEIPLRTAPAVVTMPGLPLPWLFASFARSVLAAVLVLALGAFAGAATATVDVEPAAETAVSTDQAGELAVQQAEEDPLDTLVELAFNAALDEEQVP